VQDPGEALSLDEVHSNQNVAQMPPDAAAMCPPAWSLQQLAQHLKEAIGLTMYNMDVLCPLQQSQSGVRHYRVVDINYFPGFDKLHRFEEKFADFLVTCGREAIAEQQKYTSLVHT
jgi:hypothetical protein